VDDHELKIAQFHRNIALYDAYNARLNEWKAEVERLIDTIPERHAIQEIEREPQKDTRIFGKLTK
jgi:hypothetical protein